MLRKVTLIVSVLALSLMVVGTASANPGKPDFSPRVYGDGVAWGTKGTTTLPAPNDNNVQSFDKLFVLTNGAEGQLPVSEAAPGNPLYNGGRWFTQTVTWTAAGIAAHNPLPVLKSYDDIMHHAGLEHLSIEEGSPGGPGAPPDYFQCPLLPVK